MSINDLKSLIHNLVDKSDNKYLLELIYNLFSVSSSDRSSHIWENLTGAQKELVLKAFEQSEIEESLIAHESVIAKIRNEL